MLAAVLVGVALGEHCPFLQTTNGIRLLECQDGTLQSWFTGDVNNAVFFECFCRVEWSGSRGLGEGEIGRGVVWGVGVVRVFCLLGWGV